MPVRPRGDEKCLHCKEKAQEDNVQVRCDGCSAYICNDCHWCHEFQANHEVRVCDRCDGFYCKDCDEMDQCDDCGEVVCAQCTSLLSCKFCGGGLCEECATACGRCGIVLCSRDAKFAVECDTCRLSYCLVCLASGSKDRCIRCSHRPSKRMEQLVHLRLKSIYKAFKQASPASRNFKKEFDINAHSHAPPFDPSILDNPELALCDPEKLLEAAAATISSKKLSPQDIEKAAKEKIEKFNKEKEKADAVAAALLEELEEEEKAAESKKSKKKKKKKVQNKKDDPPKDEQDDAKPPASPVAASRTEDEEIEKSNPHEDNFLTLAKAEASFEKPDDEFAEEEIEQLVDNKDIDGLEELLASIKGIPGKAAVRKNIKKAVKRLKSEMEEPEPQESYDEHQYEEVGDSSPVILDERVSDLLQVVVKTHTKSTANRGPSGACESILNMAPSIVGWVIGKGGQRIRDLMEESGAKIWIDQESMGKDEPRVVFVSGIRKNVDNAVHMIQDLISKAPTETPTHNHYPYIPDKDVPSKPAPKDIAAKSATTRPPAQATPEALPNKYVITCEARFVPLLIGRRGWTIKHIQDTSGARVDIDQSVAPRRITLSGSKEAVDTAVRMVEDVLSYPNAHSAYVEEGHGPIEEATDDFPPPPTQQSSPAMSLPSQVPVSTVSFADKLRTSNDSPIGDAKRTISPSSSLSSTPEPAHSSRSVIGGVPLQQQAPPTLRTPGLPPPIPQQPETVLPGLSNPANGMYGSSAYGPNGNMPMHGTTPFPTPSGAPRAIYQQTSSSFNSSLEVPIGMYSSGQPGMQMQSGGFPGSPPPMPMNYGGNLGGSAAVPASRLFNEPPRGSTFQGPPPSQPARPQEGMDLFSAAVDFLHNDKIRPSNGAGNGMSNAAAPAPIGSPSFAGPSLSTRESDAQFVSNLFGEAAPSGSALLGGLEGLSMNDTSVPPTTGLWSGSGAPNDTQKPKTGTTSLFPSTFSPHDDGKKQHYNQNNAWGHQMGFR